MVGPERKRAHLGQNSKNVEHTAYILYYFIYITETESRTVGTIL
jgi:hypothetical protein